jgi:exopolysaccharide production protein ExoQ
MQPVATLICVILIVGLFRVTRDPKERVSGAVWIPALWAFLAGSRPVESWFYDASDQVSKYYSGDVIQGTIFQILELSALFVVIRRQARTLTILKNNWPVLAFFAYCLLSVCWSDFSYVSFKRWFKLAGDLSVVLVVLTENNPVAAVKSVLKRSGFLLLPLSVLLILAYPGLATTPANVGVLATTFGITTNKNELGMISMLWGLGFLWCFLDARKRRREAQSNHNVSPIPYLAMVAVALWLVHVSNSATGLSCFYLGSILMLLTDLRWVNQNRLMVHWVALGVVFVAVIAIFVAPSLLSAVGRDSTLTGRRDLWVLVEGMVKNPLLGAGYDSFWLGQRLSQIWSVYRFVTPIEAHEGYIDVYINLGWVGVVLLTNMVLRGYGKLVRAVRERAVMSNLGLVYLAVAVIYNLSESAFRQTDPVWIALLAAITATRAIPTLRHPQPPAVAPDEQELVEDQLWFGSPLLL